MFYYSAVSKSTFKILILIYYNQITQTPRKCLLCLYRYIGKSNQSPKSHVFVEYKEAQNQWLAFRDSEDFYVPFWSHLFRKLAIAPISANSTIITKLEDQLQ